MKCSNNHCTKKYYDFTYYNITKTLVKMVRIKPLTDSITAGQF